MPYIFRRLAAAEGQHGDSAVGSRPNWSSNVAQFLATSAQPSEPGLTTTIDNRFTMPGNGRGESPDSVWLDHGFFVKSGSRIVRYASGKNSHRLRKFERR